MTARASGLCSSVPAPRPRAKGNNPNNMHKRCHQDGTLPGRPKRLPAVRSRFPIAAFRQVLRAGMPVLVPFGSRPREKAGCPGTPVLLDARASLHDPSTDALRSLASWLAAFRLQGFPSRYAVLTTLARARLSEVFSRFAETERMEVGVFTTLEQAVSWLGAAN